VARAVAGRLREPLDGLERGFLLETWILTSYARPWRPEHRRPASLLADSRRHRGGLRLDARWRAVGIEVKAAPIWRPEFGTALKGLVAQGALGAAHGVYAGTAERKDGPLRIWPIASFLRQLTEGNILG